MNIEHFYYFLDLVKTESVSASSKRLYISQQGLSKAIQNLEREFNLPLFARHGNRIATTDVGMDFFDLTQELLDVYQKLRRMTVEYHSQNSHSSCFPVFITPYLLSNFFPLFAGRIEDKCAELNLALIEKKPFEMNDNPGGVFINNTCICLANVITRNACDVITGSDLVFDTISEYKTHAKVAKDSYFATLESFTTKELAKLPLAVYDDDLLATWLHKLLEPYGKPNIVFSTRSRRQLNDFIQKSKLIGFCSEIAWEIVGDREEEEGITIRAIEDVLPITIGAYYKANAVLPTRVVDFIEFLRHEITELSHSRDRQKGPITPQKLEVK